MVSCVYCTLTLTLLYPPSVWTHWATHRRHPCLSRAAVSASSLLTVLLQFVRGRPGSPLYPGATQYKRLAVVCAGDQFASHVQASQSSFSQYVVRGLLSSSVYDLHVCYPVFRRDAQTLLCHLWLATSSVFVNVTVNGHTSAPYRRDDRIIASYNLQANTVVSPDLFHLPNTAASSPILTLTSFSQPALNDM